MKTQILYFFVLLFFINCHFSYSQIKSNSLYFEIMGNGIGYSVNYDRLLTKEIAARAGFSYIPKIDLLFMSFSDIISFPVTLSYLYGDGNSKLELGGGLVYMHLKGSSFLGLDMGTESGIAGTAIIGYRYQQPEGGFLFRAGFTPLFSFEDIAPSFGISFGTTF